MKRLFVLVVLALLAGVWVAGKILQDPGYVLLSYRTTTIETSFWLALLLLFVVVAMLYLVIWLVLRLLGSGRSLRGWGNRFKAHRSRKKTTHGMIDLVEGNWAAAQRKLSQAAGRSDTPLLNYLAAARAAAENGDDSGSEALLRKARESAPNAELAIALTRVEIQMQRGQNESALATLLQLSKSHPRHKKVYKLLQQVYWELQDWESLGQLMPTLRKLKVASVADLDQIEQKTLLTLMQRVVNERGDPSDTGVSATERAEKLREIWRRTQVTLRRREVNTLAYADSLKALDHEEWAEPALRDSIQYQWNESLVHRYGCVRGQDVHHQLLNAEAWLKQRPNSAVLMLTLGRLSLNNKLWGKAREYFIASLKINSSSEAAAELARLLEHLGERTASQEQMQRGFALLQAQLPELPMPNRERAVKRLAR